VLGQRWRRYSVGGADDGARSVGDGDGARPVGGGDSGDVVGSWTGASSVAGSEEEPHPRVHWGARPVGVDGGGESEERQR
jgi:hypothetical protein